MIRTAAASSARAALRSGLAPRLRQPSALARSIYIARGDAKRHANPSNGWLGAIGGAGLATYAFCQGIKRANRAGKN